MKKKVVHVLMCFFFSEKCFWPQYMYPELIPNNGYRWCPLGKLSHLGMEQLTNNLRTHHCYTTTFEIPTTGKIFTDQTGRFPIPSSTGNQYVFVLYYYDSNYIHAIAIKNRKTNLYLLLTKQHMLYLYAQVSVLFYNNSTKNAQTS